MDRKLIDLSSVPTPQLVEIRSILNAGVLASAEDKKTGSDADEALSKEVLMEEKEKIASLEQEVKDLKGEKETWNTEKSAQEIAALKDEKETLITEKAGLEEKASQVDTLTQELADQKDELETLRTFKRDTEEAAERADKIKSIKSKLEEAGVVFDEADSEYWLAKTDDDLDKTIAKMGAMVKGTQASAEVVKVPPVVRGDDEPDAVAVVKDGLKERKQERGK